MKEAAYKGMVRPILEYGSSFWNPYTDKLHQEVSKDPWVVGTETTRFPILEPVNAVKGDVNKLLSKCLGKQLFKV